jgi:hypothetical protein
LISLTNGAGTFGMLVELRPSGEGNDIRFLHRAGGSDGDIRSARPYEVGVWHHLVAVMDGGQMSLYLDGIKDAVTATNNSTVAFDTQLVIGQLLGRKITAKG